MSINSLYNEKDYVKWLKSFLNRNDNFVRLYNYNNLKHNTKKDDSNSEELFIFFRRLLRYSQIHKIADDIFEQEIFEQYGDTYMDFDCSLVLGYENILINILVLELGGSSDMIIRIVNETNEYISENSIDVDDFYNWLNDYEYGLVNCLDCSNLSSINVDYKVSGIDYQCELYKELCAKEYGILAKDENRIYPCPTCRKNNWISFNKI